MEVKINSWSKALTLDNKRVFGYPFFADVNEQPSPLSKAYVLVGPAEENNSLIGCVVEVIPDSIQPWLSIADNLQNPVFLGDKILYSIDDNKFTTTIRIEGAEIFPLNQQGVKILKNLSSDAEKVELSDLSAITIPLED